MVGDEQPREPRGGLVAVRTLALTSSHWDGALPMAFRSRAIPVTNDSGDTLVGSVLGSVAWDILVTGRTTSFA